MVAGAGKRSDLSVRVGGRELAVSHHPRIRRLHDEIFLRPPFVFAERASEEHENMLTSIREDPTFGISVALCGADLVGFTYGHRLPVDHQWWERFTVLLPAGVAEEWEGRTFALIDIGVSEKWRGKGVGRCLMDSLLGPRGERRAILSVQPSAVRAHAFYERLGWQLIGRKGPIPGVLPPFWDIYCHPLST